MSFREDSMKVVSRFLLAVIVLALAAGDLRPCSECRAPAQLAQRDEAAARTQARIDSGALKPSPAPF